MKKLSIIPLVVGLSLVIGGCGPSRKVQCNTLATAHSRIRTRINTQHQSRIGQLAYDPMHERQMMQLMSEAAQTLQAVELRDRTLQALNRRLANSYQQSSSLYQQAATLLTATDGSPSDAILKQVDALHGQVSAEIPAIVHDMNIYCIGG